MKDRSAQMGTSNPNELGASLSNFGCVPPLCDRAHGADGQPYDYRPFVGVHGCPPVDAPPTPKSYPSCSTLPTRCGKANNKWGWTNNRYVCGAGEFCPWNRGWEHKFHCDKDGTCYPNEPTPGCQIAAYRRTYPGGSRDLYTPTNVKALSLRPRREPGEPWNPRPWHPNRRIVFMENPHPGFPLTLYDTDPRKPLGCSA